MHASLTSHRVQACSTNDANQRCFTHTCVKCGNESISPRKQERAKTAIEDRSLLPELTIWSESDFEVVVFT